MLRVGVTGGAASLAQGRPVDPFWTIDGAGPSEGKTLRGDRATALIEDIWCEKIGVCSYRDATRLSWLAATGLMLGINQRHILEILDWELIYVDR
jgi:hypothetical protein